MREFGEMLLGSGAGGSDRKAVGRRMRGGRLGLLALRSMSVEESVGWKVLAGRCLELSFRGGKLGLGFGGGQGCSIVDCALSVQES